MKRRNEDDVGPVQNGIARFSPESPQGADWGEVGTSLEAVEQNDKKPFIFKILNQQHKRLSTATLPNPLWGGPVCPKARDKLVHSGISLAGTATLKW
jgi:hypothetical protein